MWAERAGYGGQREHEPKRREAPSGEVPPGRRGGRHRDPPVDDHESGQDGQPEQGAGGGGTEVAAVEEGLDQQDRPGDDG